MTKLVKSFDEGLIPNFPETWGTKNIFNPFFFTLCILILRVFLHLSQSIFFVIWDPHVVSSPPLQLIIHRMTHF